MGNLSRERSADDETNEQVVLRLSHAVANLFQPFGKILSIAASTRGHAFVMFSCPTAAAAVLEQHAVKPWTLDGKLLTVQAKGESGRHFLRSQLQEQLPPMHVQGARAYWTLPSQVGGGLVAVSVDKNGLKATKELLATQTLRFLNHESADNPQHLPKNDGSQEMQAEHLEKQPRLEQALSSEGSQDTEHRQHGRKYQQLQTDVEQVETEDVVQESATAAQDELRPELIKDDANDSVTFRNISIIAHVDHGKTTLSDCLLAAAGQLSSVRSGDACALDQGLEAERGITIYSSAVTLQYPSRDLTLNLIDCPGHAEFNSEVTAALRTSDGALLLVDAKEGMMPQSEAVLRQALSDGVRIVLVLNKIDKLLPDRLPREGVQQKPISEESLCSIYAQLQAVIDQVNSTIAAHNHASECVATMPYVALEDGTAVFGSGRLGWMASLDSFARLYAAKAVASAADSECAKSVFESARNRAYKAMTGAQREKRVAQLVLAPIAELHALAGDRLGVELDKKLQKISCGNARLSKGVLESNDAKTLRKEAFRQLLPAADMLLTTITTKLPSPSESQRSRATLLSPLPSAPNAEHQVSERAIASANAIGGCDPSAPLLLYVSKMMPLPGTKAHAAVCRLFSGTVRPGMEVFVLSCNGSSSQRAVKARVTRVLRLEAGGPPVAVSYMRAGTVCGLVGLEKAIGRGGTVTDTPSKVAPLAAMKFSVSLVERNALVTPAGASTRKLAEAIPALMRGDPLVHCAHEKDTGELVISGAGELHLEACIHRLRELMGSEGSSLSVAPASVAHRETVTSATPCTDARPGMLGKSANKHNRFWFVASAISPGLQNEIMTPVFMNAPSAERTRLLVDKHGWDAKHARRVLAFGPDGHGPNILVDATVGVQGMDGVAEHVISAFEQLCAEGPVCGERLHGVRIDVTDAKIHSEAAQRRAPQVVPAARRGMSGAILAASPALLEPMHSVQLNAPLSKIMEVYNELELRRADELCHEQDEHGSSQYSRDTMCTLRGFVPLSESSGLTEKLRGRLHGKASGLTLSFSHWRVLDGSVWVPPCTGVTTASVVMSIRERKKMIGPPPTADSVADKL